MERYKLPTGSQGNILWLGPKKGLIVTFKLARTNPYLHYIRLWITYDGGQTWKDVWGYDGWIIDGYPVNSNTQLRVEDETNLVMDARGNLYIQRMDILVKCYPTGPDNWVPQGHIIPSWPGYGITGTIAFTSGAETLHIIVEQGLQYWEFTVTVMGQWDKLLRLTIQNIDQYRWMRAGAKINGIPHWLYLNRHLDNNQWSLRLARVGRVPIPIEAPLVTFPAGSANPVGAASMTTTPDGRVHIVYSYAPTKEIFYMVKTGQNWSTPVVIGTYTGHSISSISDTSATAPYGGYQSQVVNRPYMSIQNDGFGLMVTFAEVNQPPSAGVNSRTVNLKYLTFDGTAWSSVQTLKSGISLYNNTPGSLNIFKLLGPFTTDNFGIHTFITREGVAEDDVYMYPLTVPYQPYAPKELAPANGLPSDVLQRVLTWNFSDPVPGDTQSAYQVQVIDRATGATEWDSGKVTSTVSSATVPSGELTQGKFYQWRVRTWDKDDSVGAYSQLAMFKTSSKPTVSITAPTSGSTLNTDAPQVTWTYAQAESVAQDSFRVEIINADTGNTVYDSDWQYNLNSSYTVPSGNLANGQNYIVSVRVTSADGIESVADTETFTVQYIAPPMPTVIPSLDSFGGVQLLIQAGNPANNSWQEDYFRIYRKEISDNDFTLLKDLLTIDKKLVDDFEDTAGWFQQGTATAPITSQSKEGTQALGLGATGAGTARYVSDVVVTDLEQFNRLQLWVYITDKTKFTDLEIRLGNSSVNYFKKVFPASDFTNGQWVSLQMEVDSMDIVGTPSREFALYAGIQFNGVTGAVTAGQWRVDQWRVMTSDYSYLDPTTTIGKKYIYGVSAVSEFTRLESPIVQTAPQEAKFLNPMRNIQLVPLEQPELAISGFMDGTKPPNWTSITETKYYQTRGSTKPTVLINGMQAYKEGSLEIRFFDERFGGQSLNGAEALENIKNFKPILFRTWWGRNYYISIDGEVDIVRRPGIGWFATFNFTEINE